MVERLREQFKVMPAGDFIGLLATFLVIINAAGGLIVDISGVLGAAVMPLIAIAVGCGVLNLTMNPRKNRAYFIMATLTGLPILTAAFVGGGAFVALAVCFVLLALLFVFAGSVRIV